MAVFSSKIVAWQRQQGRHSLPWQQTHDPYKIWLSEIMLQQTQVSTVLPYYQCFLADYPNVVSLANAPLADVLERWAGLGYYARARNLHHCAQLVLRDFAGVFPTSAKVLHELPGIGRSTAAAIAAFSVAERAAILDGNVKRVLCRHFAIRDYPGKAPVERQLWELAESLLPENPADMAAYTQGLMDMGATLCKRGTPDCGRCPVQSSCLALTTGEQADLPVAKPRKTLPERHTRFALIVHEGKILLERRPLSGIWGGLLVPPEGEVTDVLRQIGAMAAAAEVATGIAAKTLVCQRIPPLRHTFSHFHLTLEPELYQLAQLPTVLMEAKWEWLPLNNHTTAALPTPIRKLLAEVYELYGRT